MAFGVYSPVFIITSGTALSAEVQLNGGLVQAILMPAAWDIADISFATAQSAGGTYRDVHDAFGNEIAVSVAAGRAVMVPPGLVRAGNFLKLRSGTAGAAVNQTADRTLILLTNR
jgi:hypothetical protein